MKEGTRVPVQTQLPGSGLTIMIADLKKEGRARNRAQIGSLIPVQLTGCSAHRFPYLRFSGY